MRVDPQGNPKRRAKAGEERCGECADFLRGGKWCYERTQRAACLGCYHFGPGDPDHDWRPGEPVYKGCRGPIYIHGQCASRSLRISEPTHHCRADDAACPLMVRRPA